MLQPHKNGAKLNIFLSYSLTNCKIFLKIFKLEKKMSKKVKILKLLINKQRYEKKLLENTIKH